MNYYPTITPESTVLLYPANEIRIILSSKLFPLLPYEKKNIIIKSDAWTVLHYCNGKNSIKDIINIIKSDYCISEDYLKTYFSTMENIGILREYTKVTKSKFNVYGDGKKYFPRHVSFRVTERCNLKCSYCYMGEFDTKIPFTKYSIVETILKKLKNNHVSVLELTGGEPMIYPKIDKVISYALNNFNTLAIITNGVYFPEKIIKYLTNFKNQVSVQISIDGSDDEVSYSVRRIKGTSDKTIATIEKMIQYEILFRVSIVVDFQNVKDLENIILKLKGIGVNNILLTFSEELGYAVQPNSDSKTKFVEIYEKHGEFIGSVVSKYSDIVNVKFSDFPEDLVNITRNCGAGYKSAVINHLGDVFPCVMLNEEASKMGNILTDNYLDIFNTSKSSTICRSFNLKSREDLSCRGCAYSDYCTSCFTKVHIANKDRLRKNLGLCEVAKKQRITELVPFE